MKKYNYYVEKESMNMKKKTDNLMFFIFQQIKQQVIQLGFVEKYLKYQKKKPKKIMIYMYILQAEIQKNWQKGNVIFLEVMENWIEGT